MKFGVSNDLAFDLNTKNHMIVQARKIKDVQLANPLWASKYDNCNHKLMLLDYLAWAIMSDIFASLCFFIQLPNSFRKGVYH